MFNLQSFSSQKAAVSNGAASIALARIRGLLTKLLHSPETGVFYLQSGDASPITKGMLVRISANNTVRLTANTVGDTPLVALGDSLASGAWGFFRNRGEVEVRLVNAIDPEPSEVIYVSDTLGLGTNTDAAAAGTYSKQVGFVLDDSMYVTVTNPLVRIELEPCCGVFNPII